MVCMFFGLELSIFITEILFSISFKPRQSSLKNIGTLALFNIYELCSDLKHLCGLKARFDERQYI